MAALIIHNGDGTSYVVPSAEALREALSLSDVIIQNIEMSELPLSNIALKASRLARLLNDFETQRIFEFEVSGYPRHPNGVSEDVSRLAVKAGREFYEINAKSNIIEPFFYVSSIESLELEAKSLDVALAAAKDPDVAISSANPNQTIWSPSGNFLERNNIRVSASLAQQRLSSRRSFIYSYVVRKNHELKYSKIAGDIFSRIRTRVDSEIGLKIPTAVQKLSSVYENLESDNSEDWSNAVHSCRRILEDMANVIYPPRENAEIEEGGKKKEIKLGKENYINRIVAFIESKSASDRFSSIVGSHLQYVGNRLDSVFQAAQKGTHSNIVDKEEADRYVVYTYLIVGDVLGLI